MKTDSKKAAWIILLFSVLLLWIGNRVASAHALRITLTDYESEMNDQIFAKVTKIDSVEPSPTDPGTSVVKFTCVITAGEKKGETVPAVQYVYRENSAMPPQVGRNDKIVLGRLSSGDSIEYTFENYNRIGPVFWLALLCIGLIVAFGGKKGWKTVLSLVLTCSAIFFVFIPCIMAGFNVYASTIGICIYIITVSYVLTGGINSKSLTAAVGCSGGVAFSGAAYAVMERIMKLTGYYNDQTSLLRQTFTQCPLDFKGIVFAMVTVGALGAVMDVAMSIASSLDEIRKSKADLTQMEILRAGRNIGKDILGTMTSTLILAYIGSSLITVLIYAAAHYPILQLLNKEEIIVEILQSLIGSLGMLVTIPFTTLISARLFQKSDRRMSGKAAAYTHESQGLGKKTALHPHTAQKR